jgi:hypothetical protein
MRRKAANCYIIAGSNGAGKTTFATMRKATRLSLAEKAMQALAEAVAEVVGDHRRRDRPPAVWHNGEAIWISASEAVSLRENPTPYRTRKSNP